MTIKIQRGRQFLAGEVSTQLFDQKGKAGTYLAQASAKLVAQQLQVQLEGPAGAVKLATADDWSKFLAEHASTSEQTKQFADSFGITFHDFVARRRSGL